MVANHARKILARELMRDVGHLRYTRALELAGQIESVRGTTAADRLSKADHSKVNRAADSLVSGRDLVIFGGAASGKSTAAHAVVRATKLRTLYTLESHLEAAYFRSMLTGLPCVVRTFSSIELPLAKLGVELLVVDEPTTLGPSACSAISDVPRIIVIHGQNPKDAERRLNYILPDTELRSPSFLQAKRPLGENRSLELYEPHDVL